jgi:predicted nucleic acid-binding protein
MIYVFDSSFVGALVIPDEKNPKASELQKSIREDEDIFVPRLLWYEVANVFKNLIRRRRFTAGEVIQFFPLVAAIRLIEDSEMGINYSEKLLRFCNEYNLSSYDAAYLELAERKKAVLCTLDEGLRTAAKKRGVPVLR